MVFTWRAAHGEFEIGRISQRCQDVPRRGDQESDQQAAPWTQRFPDPASRKLPRDRQINQCGGDRKHNSDQALEQQARSKARREDKCPPSGFARRLGPGIDPLDRAQERPHGKRDAGGQHYVGNQNAGKQKQAETRRDDQAGVETRLASERPDSERGREPGKRQRGKHNRNPRHHIRCAKHFERPGNHPVNQRRLFQIRDTIEACRHIVAGTQHVAGDLRLHGIHIVHERRRRDHAAGIHRGGDQQDNRIDTRVGVRFARIRHLHSLI